MNRNEQRKTYELIPIYRRRAFMRRCFDQLVRVISRSDVTAREILDALKAFESVLSLSSNSPTEKLAAALHESQADQMSDRDIRSQLRTVVKTMYGVDLPN